MPTTATAEVVPETLAAHLARWAGAWPPEEPLHVVANPRAAQPRWDGAQAPAVGVMTETGWAVLGVDPSAAARVAEFAAVKGDVDAVLGALPDLLGRPGTGGRGSFRWTTDPAPFEDAGIWLPREDPRVPAWLRPFNDDVLVVLDGDTYVAGVGVKKHDAFGHEISVGTQEEARGRGLARRLVSQAARRILDEGRVPTYLHAPDNVASAKVAQACGFADRGWSVLGFFPAR
ncbi:GNAT family N-acetyltransferase [Kineosporia sp. A_224]|uniref:GNAT family N-acetyltransferase n=1 Tax=Kineosporia sp. A_224 TaxID=1962180 RepID=UPI0018E94DA7|nr:GNAT family N-acetyltransferase [Kineosporia sp. A_224]